MTKANASIHRSTGSDRESAVPGTLLEVDRLNVRFATGDGEVHAVRDLSYTLAEGDTLGLVGESGSGKSQSVMAVTGLLADNGRAEGSVRFRGEELIGAPQAALRRIRGRRIAMIFQDPMTSLNPHLTVFSQMHQVLARHEGLNRRASRRRCIEMLDAVRIPQAASRIDSYPHEFSGGMRQRVMIASALLCRPDVLIADEPTTALDVTVQAQILQLMRDIRERFGTAILLITHDLGVVAGLCDRVLVMRHGQAVDGGDVDDVFHRPRHDYTRALLAAVPRLDVVATSAAGEAGFAGSTPAATTGSTAPGGPDSGNGGSAADAGHGTTGATGSGAAQHTRPADGADASTAAHAVPTRGEGRPAGAATSAEDSARVDDGASGAAPLIDAHDLRVHFPVPGEGLFARARTLKAVDGVDLSLAPGETLGVVGESGCGKSTLARALLRLVPLTAGRIVLHGIDISAADRRAMRPYRRDMQVIFQDPLASLNPRMTVGDIVAEPLWTHAPKLARREVRAKAAAMLERVGLEGAHLNRYPHEFSGGQCQRIGIARALVLGPRVLICDEPVSALDVSIQAQIVRLLMDIQAETGLALVFIAHDLAVVQQISHRIMVMYLGRAVEVADRHALYRRPMHPYTQALIRSVPIPDPRLERARGARPPAGDLPSPLDPPTGCAFRTRCPYAVDRCRTEVPALRRVGDSLAACHEAERVRAALDRGEAA